MGKVGRREVRRFLKGRIMLRGLPAFPGSETFRRGRVRGEGGKSTLKVNDDCFGIWYLRCASGRGEDTIKRNAFFAWDGDLLTFDTFQPIRWNILKCLFSRSKWDIC